MNKVEGLYWIYIARSVNGSLYTGIAADIDKRMRKHLEGKGAKFTRSFRLVSMERLWQIEGGRGRALSVEGLIKKLKKKEKEALVKKPSLLNYLLSLKEQQFKISLCQRKLVKVNRIFESLIDNTIKMPD